MTGAPVACKCAHLPYKQRAGQFIAAFDILKPDMAAVNGFSDPVKVSPICQVIQPHTGPPYAGTLCRARGRADAFNPIVRELALQNPGHASI